MTLSTGTGRVFHLGMLNLLLFFKCLGRRDTEYHLPRSPSGGRLDAADKEVRRLSEDMAEQGSNTHPSVPHINPLFFLLVIAPVCLSLLSGYRIELDTETLSHPSNLKWR